VEVFIDETFSLIGWQFYRFRMVGENFKESQKFPRMTSVKDEARTLLLLGPFGPTKQHTQEKPAPL